MRVKETMIVDLETFEQMQVEIQTLRARNVRLEKASPNTAKKFCKRGHPFDEQNTYNDPSGRRRCKTCQKSYIRKPYTPEDKARREGARKARLARLRAMLAEKNGNWQQG